jgi:biopolymer transport protein ExbB
MNFTSIFEQGDPVLVATFLLLIGMSLASWYIIFWKCLKLKYERQQLDAYRADAASAGGAVATLVREAERLKPLLAARHTQGASAQECREMLAMHLAQALDTARTWLDKGLTVLASVGSAAPFIGLFGTVWGIYHALTRIAAEGNASLDVVAGPMGEALVATAIGLFAAIPAVLAYNAFVRLNRLLVQDLRHIAEQITAYAALEAPVKGGPVKSKR